MLDGLRRNGRCLGRAGIVTGEMTVAAVKTGREAPGMVSEAVEIVRAEPEIVREAVDLACAPLEMVNAAVIIAREALETGCVAGEITSAAVGMDREAAEMAREAAAATVSAIPEALAILSPGIPLVAEGLLAVAAVTMAAATGISAGTPSGAATAEWNGGNASRGPLSAATPPACSLQFIGIDGVH